MDTIKCQDEGVRAVRSVVSGRIQTPLLLAGPDGVGKRSTVLAAARLAFSRGIPDSPHIKRINSGIHPDLLFVYPEDDKDIGIDAIRTIVEISETFPTTAHVRYVVIENADRMTVPAANALLKTLEEQPVTTRFFLLTETYHRVIPTIRSRCGLVRYYPLPESVILEHLAQFTSDTNKALFLARSSEGSLGEASRVLNSGRVSLRNKMLTLLESGLVKNLSAVFSVVDSVEGDLNRALRFLDHLLRDLLVLDYAPDRITNVDILETLVSLKKRMHPDMLTIALDRVPELRLCLRDNVVVPFHVKASLATIFVG